MGLERHIEEVLDRAGIVRHLYRFENGMVVPDDVDAKIIMKVLKESGEFGPTYYNDVSCKIEFGVAEQFFEGDDYENYCKCWESLGTI